MWERMGVSEPICRLRDVFSLPNFPQGYHRLLIVCVMLTEWGFAIELMPHS